MEKPFDEMPQPHPVLVGFSQEQADSLDRVIQARVDRAVAHGIEQTLQHVETLFDRIFEKQRNMWKEHIDSPRPILTPSTSTEAEEDKVIDPQRKENYLTKDDSNRKLAEKPSFSPNIEPPIPSEPLQAKDIGFFDADYEDCTSRPVAYVGRHVIYRDVYMFVERLKHLARTHRDNVKADIIGCFRGQAAHMWWTYELTDLEKDDLWASDLATWCTTLIDRFKMRASVALKHFTSESRRFTMHDIKTQSPKAWIHQMLRYAKAAEFGSLHVQLTIIWNHLDIELSQHVPVPTPSTTLAMFIEQVESRTFLWKALAEETPPQQYQQPSPQQQPQQPQGRQSYQPRSRERPRTWQGPWDDLQ